MVAYLFFAIIIFCLGLYGVLTHKEALRIFISVEIMVAAVNLMLAGFLIGGSTFPSTGPGQALTTGGSTSNSVVSDGLVFLFFVWLFTIANAVVGLPLFLRIKRKAGTQNMDELQSMKG